MIRIETETPQFIVDISGVWGANYLLSAGAATTQSVTNWPFVISVGFAAVLMMKTMDVFFFFVG